jgi:glycine cleavage system regulatory protein
MRSNRVIRHIRKGGFVMMTHTDLVLTAIGPDRPGLVEKLSGVVAEHDGNWLESSMAQLAGQFAGIVRVRVATERAGALQAALKGITALRVQCEVAEAPAPVIAAQQWQLDVVGHDRPGIVREVSQVLARHAVNVESLETYTAPAAMSGETLFHAEARLAAEGSVSAQTVQRELEALSTELMVELYPFVSQGQSTR